MSNTESQKILIAGAGPAGAAFAQILRANNIPYEIFEREKYLNERIGAGFLLDSGLEAIMKLVPEDLGDPRVASSNRATGEVDTSGFIDADKKIVVARTTGTPYGEHGYTMLARRGDFRSYISQHLPIQTNKRIARYEEDLDGVTAYFTDGTSAKGAMLVAADGSQSVIRKQLLSNPPTEFNSHVPITGEVELPRHAFLPLLQVGNGAVIANADTCNLALARMSVAPDGSSAKYWWVASFVSKDPKADTAWVQAATPTSLKNRALEACKDMPQILIDPIRRTPESGIWQPQIRFTEWVPPMALPRGRVTLLGDAAHNTTPFGGMGANTALKDAADLAGLIKSHIATHGSIRNRGDVDWILKRYEDVMLPRGRALVLGSRAVADAGSDYAPMMKKGHAGLDLVNLPLVDNWTFGLTPPASDDELEEGEKC